MVCQKLDPCDLLPMTHQWFKFKFDTVGWVTEACPACKKLVVSLLLVMIEAVTASVRSAWKRFREYLPIVTGKGFSLKLKGNVHTTFVRSCLMHGSETWPMKVEHDLKMNRTEMSIIRWTCGLKLNERKKSEELKRTLRIGTSHFDDQKE